MRVVEISECFPNKHKPVTGEFILRHGEALSKLCNVKLIVPLRMIPSREIFSGNVFQKFSDWKSGMSSTENYTNGKLEVEYFRYISLPRPYFESLDSQFLHFSYYGKLKKSIDSFKPDVLLCHWLRPWAEPASAIADDLGIPFIIDHHEDIPTMRNLFPGHYRKFLRPAVKAATVIVHSSGNKSDLMNEVRDLKNVDVNYLGQSMIIDSSEKNFCSDQLRIVCVSHLHEPRKKIDTLIKACDILCKKINLTLRIIGDGILKQKYIDIAASLNLANIITFEGQKSQSEINEILDECDVFVLPSYPEAFGIAIIEAMAKGLPVIASAGNGAGEEIKGLGYDVELPEPDSSSALADAILNLSKDKMKMKELSISGKQLVSEYFTWDKNAEGTFKIMEREILRKRERRVRN